MCALTFLFGGIVFIAFLIVGAALYGLMGMFLSILTLVFLAGTWAVLRDTPHGVFSPYKLNQKYPRLEAVLEKSKVDDLVGAFIGAPVGLSIFMA
jgi:hypothetical protein